MKSKKIILSIIAFLVLTGAVVALFVFGNKSTKVLPEDVVTFESEGSEMAVTMALPKDKFSYTIEKEDYPLFPELLIKDANNKFNISSHLYQIETEDFNKELEEARQKKDFLTGSHKDGETEINWYSYDEEYGYLINACLKNKVSENTRYCVGFNILPEEFIGEASEGADLTPAPTFNGKAVFESSDFQNILKSLRLVADYKAPERASYSDYQNIITLNKLPEKIDNFAIKQEIGGDSVVVFAYATPEKTIDFTITPLAINKNIDAFINDDDRVKNGELSFSQSFSLNGWSLRMSSPVKDINNEDLVEFYAQKDIMVLQGTATYKEEYKATFDKFLEEIFKNLSYNKERAEKYLSIEE